MKKICPFLFLLALLVLTGCPPDPPENGDDKEVVYTYVFDEVVHSSGLEDNLVRDNPDRSVKVYLPPDYYDDTTLHFPVIYLLHGYFCSEETWYTGLTPTRDFAYIGMNIQIIMDSLIKAEAVQSMILVTPNSYNYFKGSWYTNSIVTGNWEDFIVEDVVSFVDNNYRTITRPGGRGITGHSMGGYGAMKLAMKHPDIFSTVYTHSSGRMDLETWMDIEKDSILKAMSITEWKPASMSLDMKVIASEFPVFAPNPDAEPFYGDFPLTPSGETVDSTWEKYLMHDPLSLISLYEDNLNQLRGIAFDHGTLEDNIAVSQHFSAELTAHGIEHQFELFEGDHISSTVKQMKTKIIHYLSDHLDHAE